MNCEYYNVLTLSLIENHSLISMFIAFCKRERPCIRVSKLRKRGPLSSTRNKTCKREFGRIKGENFCRIGRAGWIYLIYVRKPRNTLNSARNYRPTSIYIYMYKTALNRVKCNRHFVKHQIYTVSNLSIAFASARFLHDISNKHVENYK